MVNVCISRVVIALSSRKEPPNPDAPLTYRDRHGSRDDTANDLGVNALSFSVPVNRREMSPIIIAC